MGNLLNMTLLDFWNDPAIRLLRFGTKVVAKAATSAYAKGQIDNAKPTELSELFARASDGDSHAQYFLSLHYSEQKDYNSAMYWLEKSAQNGSEHAKEVLEMLQD